MPNDLRRPAPRPPLSPAMAPLLIYLPETSAIQKILKKLKPSSKNRYCYLRFRGIRDNGNFYLRICWSVGTDTDHKMLASLRQISEGAVQASAWRES